MLAVHVRARNFPPYSKTGSRRITPDEVAPLLTWCLRAYADKEQFRNLYLAPMTALAAVGPEVSFSRTFTGQVSNWPWIKRRSWFVAVVVLRFEFPFSTLLFHVHVIFLTVPRNSIVHVLIIIIMIIVCVTHQCVRQIIKNELHLD